MKMLIRLAAIMAIIAGCLLCFIGSEFTKSSQPKQAEIGIVSNGEYQEVETIDVGGDEELEKDGKKTGWLGGIFLAGGVIGLIAAAFVQEPSNKEE